MLGSKPAHGQTSVEASICFADHDECLWGYQSSIILSMQRCLVYAGYDRPSYRRRSYSPSPRRGRSYSRSRSPAARQRSYSRYVTAFLHNFTPILNLHLVASLTQLTGTWLTLLKCLGFDLEQQDMCCESVKGQTLVKSEAHQPRHDACLGYSVFVPVTHSMLVETATSSRQ